MAMPVTRRWTAADVRELTQEDRPWPRYELLDGELLVTPAPGGPHQIAVAEILYVLMGYLRRVPVGIALTSPADLELREGTITQPDVFVAPRGISSATGEPSWSEISELLLAVEVLSVSSARIDRVMKRDFYLANKVDEYWIVDCASRVVERWRPSDETPDLLRENLVWSPRGGEAFVIDVVALFDRIHDDWQAFRRTNLGRQHREE